MTVTTRRINLCKTIAFAAIFVCLLMLLNFQFQPLRMSWWATYYMPLFSFEAEPKDTIQVLALGSSHVTRGFTPVELYRNYGICAYNLGTAGQPMAVSYYLARHVYRRHSASLKVILLCGNGMFSNSILGAYQTADWLDFDLKYDAVSEYPLRDGKDKLFYRFSPLLQYHDRWDEFTEDDLKKWTYQPVFSLRGYGPSFFPFDWFNRWKYWQISVPPVRMDPKAPPLPFDRRALRNALRLVDFCKEKGIKLVLFSPLNARQPVQRHNALAAFAREHGLDYIDFNAPPLFNALRFNMAVDMYNDSHMNYYGAAKLTSYMGKYMADKCGVPDVRGSEKYRFMDAVLKGYERDVMGLKKLTETANVLDYLKEVLSKRYSAFVMVRDTAVRGLSDADRKVLAAMGFTGFLNLRKQSPYLAVVRRGKVVYENPAASAAKSTAPPRKLSYKGRLDNGWEYVLESGGYTSGNLALCRIDGRHYSLNRRGINIVVFDDDRGEAREGFVIDRASFDTHVSPFRDAGYKKTRLENALKQGKEFGELSNDLKALYQYNYRCERVWNVQSAQALKYAKNLDAYLASFWNAPNCQIFLTVRGDAADALSDEARRAARARGLLGLAGVLKNDAYAAIVYEGKVEAEECVSGAPAAVKFAGTKAVSGGDRSQVLIDGVNRSPNYPGFNVVVYDTFMRQVLDTAVF